MTKKNLHSFQHTLLDWYQANKREFLWRREAPVPFLTLVSEVMLQQTQTSRVEEKLPLFLEQFPTISALAEANNADIIRAWKGMGYNNRALRLRDAARIICQRHNAIIPQTIQELLALPGIGHYTATALLAFSFGKDVAVIDVNIRRVYSRIFHKMETTAATLPEAHVNQIAEDSFPRGRASEWHQALMDIGALFCTARKPDCIACPLRFQCESAGEMIEFTPPKKTEPSYKSIPRRIWRGKTVELLRNAPQLSSEIIAINLFGKFPTPEDYSWLKEILTTLQKDGIIRQEDEICMLQE
jgi:A/G-specific adenine glycosylase